MRLPWPIGRRSPSDGPSPAASEEARRGNAPAEAAPAADVAAPPTGAWATLPPIQRVTGGPPLVAPSAPFLDAVPGHQPLPPIVGPLGHDAGPGAPVGLVAAHASPLPTLTSRAPMPVHPVQRAGATAAGSAQDAWAADADIIPPAPSAGPSEASATATASAASAEPVRRLATVSPAATVTPSARPLTQAPAVPAPRRETARRAEAAAPAALPGLPPLVARSASAGRSAGRWSEASAGSPAPRAGLGAPLGSDVGPQAQPAAAAPAVAPAPATSSATTQPASSAPPPASASSRRSGLGSPLPAAPPTAVTQRLPIHAASRRTNAPGSDVLAPSAPAPAPRPLPVLSVSRSRAGASTARRSEARSSDSSRAASPAGGGAPRAASATVGGSPRPTVASSTTTVPTLGSRPLWPAVAVHHDAAAAAPDAVPARWAAGDDLPATVRTVPPGDTLDDGPVPLQALAASPASSASGSPAGFAGLSGSASAPREIVFPPRDEPGPGPGGPGAGAGAGAASGPWSGGAANVQRLAAVPQATPFAPGRPGPARRHGTAASTGPLALARPPAPIAAAVPSYPTPVAAPAGRVIADPVGSLVAVQASHSGSPTGSGGGFVTATPVVQRVDGAAPAPPAAADEGHSDSELDELARALFGRIRTQLRADVIHDREARGLTFDAF